MFGCPTNLNGGEKTKGCDVKPLPERSVLSQEVCRAVIRDIQSSLILCATKQSKLTGPLTHFLKHQTASSSSANGAEVSSRDRSVRLRFQFVV